MDLDKLSNGEKIAGVSAIVLFIFMFFDWFSVDVSGFGGSASAGGSAWDALDVIPIILVIAILAALGVVVLRLMDSPYEPPISANAIVAVLGAISFLLILFRIIDTPDAGSFPGVSVDVSPAFGIFVSLIAAAGITYGAYKAMQEEGVTFSDVGDRLSGGGSGSGTSRSTQPPAAAAPPPPPPAQQAPPPPQQPPVSGEQPPAGGQAPPPPPPPSAP